MSSSSDLSLGPPSPGPQRFGSYTLQPKFIYAKPTLNQEGTLPSKFNMKSSEYVLPVNGDQDSPLPSSRAGSCKHLSSISTLSSNDKNRIEGIPIPIEIGVGPANIISAENNRLASYPLGSLRVEMSYQDYKYRRDSSISRGQSNRPILKKGEALSYKRISGMGQNIQSKRIILSSKRVTFHRDITILNYSP